MSELESLDQMDEMKDIENELKNAFDAPDNSNSKATDHETDTMNFQELLGQLGSYMTSPKISLKFENRSNNPDPAYATDGSSGFDLRANIPDQKTVVLYPMERMNIPTGIYFEVPEDLEIQVRPRSGLAVKFGFTVLNAPGTVDSDYRGECTVIGINLGQQPFQFNHGDRIAQAVLCPVVGAMLADLERVEKIDDNTKRSSNGFGSTGVK